MLLARRTPQEWLKSYKGIPLVLQLWTFSKVMPGLKEQIIKKIEKVMDRADNEKA